jgi:DNA-binding response OmpR family regulator
MRPAHSHILVVDDNEDILQSISVMLVRKSFKVSIKNRIENFEQEVRNLLPDLILLDKNLGWADGCDLCKSLKLNSDLSDIPVIMFSAYDKKREECMEAGASNFLEKPFEMKALLEMIASFAR